MHRSRFLRWIPNLLGWLISPSTLVALVIAFGGGIWAKLSGLPAVVVGLIVLGALAFSTFAIHQGLLLLDRHAERAKASEKREEERQRALAKLLADSLKAGKDAAWRTRPPILDAWEARTREIVTAAYGEGEAAHVFTPELKPWVPPEPEQPARSEIVNNVKALLGRVPNLSINDDFDPEDWTVFDEDAFLAENMRPLNNPGKREGHQICPWCGEEFAYEAHSCGACGARDYNEMVFRRESLGNG